MKKLCRTYEWVMSHIWRSCVALMDESCRIHENVIFQVWMGHVTNMKESFCIYEWGMSCIEIRHLTHRNKSCEIREWVMPHRHIVNKESWWRPSIWMSHGIYEWVMAYMNWVMSQCMHIANKYSRWWPTMSHGIGIHGPSHGKCEWVMAHTNWVMVHVNESWHIWTQSWQMWMSHGTYELSHVSMYRHIANKDSWRRTIQWMSHGTCEWVVAHMNWVVSRCTGTLQIKTPDKCMNESWYIWKSHGTYESSHGTYELSRVAMYRHIANKDSRRRPSPWIETSLSYHYWSTPLFPSLTPPPPPPSFFSFFFSTNSYNIFYFIF